MFIAVSRFVSVLLGAFFHKSLRLTNDLKRYQDSLPRPVEVSSGFHTSSRSPSRSSYHIEEEVPSHRKTKGTVYPLAAESNERRRHREIRHHLGEAFVDCPHHTSPDDESNEEACGSAFGKCRAHLDVQRFQRSAAVHSAVKLNIEATSNIDIRETNRFRWLRQSRKVELPCHEGCGAKIVSQKLCRRRFLEQHLRYCY